MGGPERVTASADRSGRTYRSGRSPYPILGIDDFAEAAREASANARGVPLRGMHARARSREQAHTETFLNPVRSLIVEVPETRENRGLKSAQSNGGLADEDRLLCHY